MTKPLSPQRWANDLTVVLRSAFGAERFPVDVKEIAMAYSAQRFPDDPVTLVRGANLPGFEGALAPSPPGKRGWGIFYNSAISSSGRMNFTLGHEFGHYLIHRLDYPKGFKCNTEDMASWDSKFGQLEHQANVFAATLLMPLDDFRGQIAGDDQPTLEALGACADRYAVSLMAATLRWLQYTEQRSVLVLSRDGFILWARSSDAAMKDGLFYRTRNCSPIETPSRSLAARRERVEEAAGETEHDEAVWLSTPCKEIALFSEQYDYTFSLLHFGIGNSQCADGPSQTELYDIVKDNYSNQ